MKSLETLYLYSPPLVIIPEIPSPRNAHTLFSSRAIGTMKKVNYGHTRSRVGNLKREGGNVGIPSEARNGEEDVSDEVDEDSDYDSDKSWITWFCGLRGNEMLVEVPEAFIRDRFNLTGLSHQVPFYERALLVILEMEEENEDVLETLKEEHQEMVEAAAEMLYGLIHARFIVSTQGLSMMRRKLYV